MQQSRTMIKTSLTNHGKTILRSKFPQFPVNPSIKTLISSISTTPNLHKPPNGSNPDHETPKLLVVQPRIRPKYLMQAKLNEAINLANSLDEQRDGCFTTDLSCRDSTPHIVVQNPLSGSVKGRSDTYFGSGTVENIKCHMHAVESMGEKVDAIFVNATLSAVQQRNLEWVWDIPVLDRVGLIIAIFHAHAHTNEARLQAELAALMCKKSRLVRVRGSSGSYSFGEKGDSEVVSARGRGSGGQGFIGGAGETELQLQRRRISDRRKYLLGKIAEVRKTRAVQRAGRKKRGTLDDEGLATVAIVGYTNAGKSTLVSALSHSDLYSDDRLFATVDPRVRGVTLPSGRKVLLSDTVGFISDLPVQLVEAFHATLEEVVEADLLVHVLDSSAVNLEEQRTSVLDVLRQIGVSKKKIEDMIDVWNKIDLPQETVMEDDEDDDVEEIIFHVDRVNLERPISPQIDLQQETVMEDNQDDGDEEIYENEGDISEGKQLLGNEARDLLSDDSVDGLEPGVACENGKQQDCFPNGSTPSHDQAKRICEESRVEGPDTDSDPPSEHAPHVKTSAVTGIGLKQLLVMIDEKLMEIDKERRSETVVERSVFERKWRSPRVENADIAVEQ